MVWKSGNMRHDHQQFHQHILPFTIVTAQKCVNDFVMMVLHSFSWGVFAVTFHVKSNSG